MLRKLKLATDSQLAGVGGKVTRGRKRGRGDKTERLRYAPFARRPDGNSYRSSMLFNDKQLSAVGKKRTENWIIGGRASEFEGHN